MSASIDAFFATAGLKTKLEPATRIELRQVIESDITGLLAIINHIATTIYTKEHLIPLLLIDDMDKPDLEKARAIFHDRREIIMQPNCAIVYTVSSALFYSKEFDSIRDQALFLPNINLHPPMNPNVHNEEGYNTMRRFIHVRMLPDLIEDFSARKRNHLFRRSIPRIGPRHSDCYRICKKKKCPQNRGRRYRVGSDRNKKRVSTNFGQGRYKVSEKGCRKQSPRI